MAEFVTETLCEIEAGIRKANEQTSAARGHKATYFEMSGNPGADFKQKIDFDVGVTTKVAASGTATAGTKLFVVSGDLEGKGEYGHAEISRVKFSVRVAFALT